MMEFILNYLEVTCTLLGEKCLVLSQALTAKHHLIGHRGSGLCIPGPVCTTVHTVPNAGSSSGRAGPSDGLQGRHKMRVHAYLLPLKTVDDKLLNYNLKIDFRNLDITKRAFRTPHSFHLCIRSSLQF